MFLSDSGKHITVNDQHIVSHQDFDPRGRQRTLKHTDTKIPFKYQCWDSKFQFLNFSSSYILILKWQITLISVTQKTCFLYITWSWFPMRPLTVRWSLANIKSLSESGKHCSHEKKTYGCTHIFPLLLHVFVIFWFFKITFTYSVTSFQYTTTTSVCMYGCASRPLLTMLNSERRQHDGDWRGLFFFSDIPRIPDTSHPPLESSKFLLWDVGTYIYSY